MFHELYIHCTRNVFLQFINDITNHMPENWTYRTESFLGHEFFFFVYDGNDFPKVEVSITRNNGENCYYVPNIVPTEVTEINQETYNTILDHFKEIVIDPHQDLFEAVEIVAEG